jgi:hypothetical protein
MRRRISLLGVALAATTSIIGGSAAAAGTASVGLKVPAHAQAGKPTTVTWHASNVSGDTVVLQREVGTTWKTIHHLSGTGGTTTVPKLRLGVYLVRVAAYSHSGKVVTATARRLHVFGTVSFTTLFNRSSRETGTYSTPSQNFYYAFSFYNSNGQYTALAVKNSPCDSVHVEFIPGTDPYQRVPNPKSVSLSIGVNGHPVATRNDSPQNEAQVGHSLQLHHAWSLYVAQPSNGGQTITWYVNGSASCDSTQVNFGLRGAN